MTLLGQVLTDQQAPLRSRAAAAILLLYAQSVSRITRLTIDDLIRDGDQTGPSCRRCPARTTPAWCSDRDYGAGVPGPEAGDPMTTTNRPTRKTLPAADGDNTSSAATIEQGPGTTAASAAPTAAPPAPAAAPLAPPIDINSTPAASLVAPMPPIPAGVDAFLGYVTDDGKPLNPDDLFDMFGDGTIVTAKVGCHALIRRGNSRTKLQTLASTQARKSTGPRPSTRSSSPRPPAPRTDRSRPRPRFSCGRGRTMWR
jgi:hypothetical protein